MDDISKNRKFYIYGNDWFDRSEVFDFTTGEWNTPPFVFPEVLKEFFMHEDKLYAFSKYGEQQIMYVCNFDDKIWIKVETIIPFDLSGRVSVASLNDCLYVYDDSTQITFDTPIVGVKDIWQFSFKTRIWQSVTPMKKPHHSCRLVVLQGNLYAIKVDTTYEGFQMKEAAMTMERYNPQSDEWTIVFNLDSKADMYNWFAPVGLNDKIYLCGGMIDGKIVALTKAYDLKTQKWTEMASMNTARYGHAVLEYKGKIWIFGGNNGKKDISSVEVYDPISNSWRYGDPPYKIKGFVEQGCIFSMSS